ncbi:hypothetical protein [Streptomyces sp. NPDC097610]|uniref:hypothetical protein n=1 Tax=Streptomyces sp. NPDC097610 TaxID=3157227 RepID=UPI003331824A
MRQDATSWRGGVRTLQGGDAEGADKPATLVLPRRVNAPAAMPVLEAALRVLTRVGLEGAAAVHALRAFVAFLIGTLAREVGPAPTCGGAIPGAVAGRERDLVKSGLPAVPAVGADPAFCDHAAEMWFGVDLFVDGVCRRVDPAG